METHLITKLLLTLFLIPLIANGNNSWQVPDSVWIYGIGAKTDSGLIYTPEFYFSNYLHLPAHPLIYQNAHKGDLVWIQAHHLPWFQKHVLPILPCSIVLVVCSDLDLSVPQDLLSDQEFEELLASDKILHLFTTNFHYLGTSPKVSPLPIGINFQARGYVQQENRQSPLAQEKDLRAVIQSLPPTSARKKRILAEFQHNDTMARARGERAKFYAGETRESIFDCIMKTDLVDPIDPCPRLDLWEKQGEYAFCVSPHGHGLDCHRTWESLLLGCIVIVKTSPLDPLYEGLPVVIVDSWEEITEENLEKWFELYKDAFRDPEVSRRLTTNYWVDKIRQKSKEGFIQMPSSSL